MNDNEPFKWAVQIACGVDTMTKWLSTDRKLDSIATLVIVQTELNFVG